MSSLTADGTRVAVRKECSRIGAMPRNFISASKNDVLCDAFHPAISVGNGRWLTVVLFLPDEAHFNATVWPLTSHLKIARDELGSFAGNR